LKGKRVAVTGANRGIGLAIATELKAHGARIVAINRSNSDELQALEPEEVILGIDVRNDEQCEAIKDQIKGGPIDIVSRFLEILVASK
jgi:NAD(P)-dependent dehydrogenase (short-subunit alcohol dehydrogenase family)